MLNLNKYRITALSQDIRTALIERDISPTWIIVAKTPESAWSKFVTQRFGTLKPNPVDYAVVWEGKRELNEHGLAQH